MTCCASRTARDQEQVRAGGGAPMPRARVDCAGFVDGHLRTAPTCRSRRQRPAARCPREISRKVPSCAPRSARWRRPRWPSRPRARSGLPTFKLALTSGFEGVDPPQTFADHLGASYDGAVTMPIFDGGLITSHIQQAQAAEHAAIANQKPDRTPTEARPRRRVLQAIATRCRQLRILADSKATADDAFALDWTRFLGGGNVTMLEVLDAFQQAENFISSASTRSSPRARRPPRRRCCWGCNDGPLAPGRCCCRAASILAPGRMQNSASHPQNNAADVATPVVMSVTAARSPARADARGAASARHHGGDATYYAARAGGGPRDGPQSAKRRSVRTGQVIAHVINREIEAAEHGLEVAQQIDPAEAAALARSVNRYARQPGIAVTAPENAIVSQRLVSSGQIVTDQEPLADLIDPKSIYVEAAVPVDDISLVRPGMSATVTSPLDPGVDFPARVAALSPSFTPGAATSPARLEFDRRPDNHRSGGSGGDPCHHQKRARRDRDSGRGAVRGRRQRHLLRIRGGLRRQRASDHRRRRHPQPERSANHLRTRTGATRYHFGRLRALRRAAR